MLRLIGILTGSALAVAFLIIALGLPRFSPPGERLGEDDADSSSAADAVVAPVESAPAKAAPVAPDSAAPAAELSEAADDQPLDQPSDEPVDEPVDEAADSLVSDAETEALIEDIFTPRPRPAAADAPSIGTVDADERWYAFWSPFRSEIAANGFVARLQETTGIDYRVVKVKTGVYEVAFAYVDDADIQDKLARISDATGLDMSGG